MAGGSEGGLRNCPLVSIIIPTFNSGATIGACLKSIRVQTYPNIEVIVVDRYSKDGTREIAEKFNAKTLLMNAERSAARNRGVAAAKGSFVFFLDSDMELTPKVVEECITACLQKNLDAVDIPEVSITKGFLAECRKIDKELHIGDWSSKMPRFFRKRIFFSVGGYDENLVFGEDFDLNRRVEMAGYRIGRVKTEIRHYEGRLSMKKIVLKTYHYGKSLPTFIGKNPSLVMRGYCPIRFVKNFWVLREHPIHFMGVAIIKLVEYMAYLTGALSAVIL